MDQKFPNVEDFTLWGNLDSDISKLPKLSKLKKFSSDFEHLITIEEANRLALSNQLESISIDRAESVEVFNLLKILPSIKELHVDVYNSDGEVTSYEL